MSACRLCFSLCRRCLYSGSEVAAGLPACRYGPDFVVISCRVVSFCVRSGRPVMAGPVSGCCVSVRRTHIVNAIPLLHADLSKTTNLRQNMAKQYSHSERQQHLHAWQQSGLSKKHYCQQHDLNPATFYYWLKHHRDDDAVTVPAAFIPVRRVMPGNNDADMVTLNLPTGCSVRCLPAQLRAVMQALSLC